MTGRHSLHGRLELCDCRVSVVPPGIDPEGTCFMLENPKKPFRVEAKTAQESTEWRGAVEDNRRTDEIVYEIETICS